MKKNSNFYSKNHTSLIKQYNSISSPLKPLFDKYIKPNHKVLDIGFGSGRDLRYIKSLGADCYGVDNCKEFVEAVREDNYFRDRVFLGSLPYLKLDIGIEFDVITIVAVLMHLSLDEIALSIQNLKKYLVNGGLIIVSYSTTPRDDNERFFEDLRGGVVEKTFLDSGFKLVENNKSLDSLGRGIEWRSEVFTLDKQILKNYNVGNKN
ncbi:MAG: class I SAM-dependent methyltransferase [Epsilonproteobacteria bacterium]|nr:class I SAM-dependent methyltransferase [Campylobacterota bacterium]